MISATAKNILLGLACAVLIPAARAANDDAPAAASPWYRQAMSTISAWWVKKSKKEQMVWSIGAVASAAVITALCVAGSYKFKGGLPFKISPFGGGSSSSAKDESKPRPAIQKYVKICIEMRQWVYVSHKKTYMDDCRPGNWPQFSIYVPATMTLEALKDFLTLLFHCGREIESLTRSAQNLSELPLQTDETIICRISIPFLGFEQCYTEVRSRLETVNHWFQMQQSSFGERYMMPDLKWITSEPIKHQIRNMVFSEQATHPLEDLKALQDHNNYTKALTQHFTPIIKEAFTDLLASDATLEDFNDMHVFRNEHFLQIVQSDKLVRDAFVARLRDFDRAHVEQAINDAKNGLVSGKKVELLEQLAQEVKKPAKSGWF